MAVVNRDRFLKVGGFALAAINCEDHDLILRLGTARFCSDSPTDDARLSAARGRRYEGPDADCGGRAYLVEQERCGRYPGGSERATERRSILGRRLRPITVECLRRGRRREAWQLYSATFAWHVQLGRWKYLIGFPLKAILAA